MKKVLASFTSIISNAQRPLFLCRSMLENDLPNDSNSFGDVSGKLNTIFSSYKILFNLKKIFPELKSSLTLDIRKLSRGEVNINRCH